MCILACVCVHMRLSLLVSVSVSEHVRVCMSVHMSGRASMRV